MAQHPLTTIQQQQPTKQDAKGGAMATPQQLRTGLIHSAAAELYQLFVKTADNKTTRLLYELAQSKGFTIAEYEIIEREAVDMAKAADAAEGWKKPQGATGAKAKGPKQSSMEVRASERKAVFGVMKLNLSAIVSMPQDGIFNPDTLPRFDEALKKSRLFLTESKLTWKGEKRTYLQDQRINKLQLQASDEAWQQVTRRIPRKDNEPMREYQARIADDLDSEVQSVVETKLNEEADKIAAALIQQRGMQFCLAIADHIIEASSKAPTEPAKQTEPAKGEAPAGTGGTGGDVAPAADQPMTEQPKPGTETLADLPTQPPQ